MIRYKKYQNGNQSSPAYKKWFARAVADEARGHRQACRAHGSPQHTLFKGMHTGSAPRHGGLHQGTAHRGQERENRQPCHIQRGHYNPWGQHGQGVHPDRKHTWVYPALPRHWTAPPDNDEERDSVQGRL